MTQPLSKLPLAVARPRSFSIRVSASRVPVAFAANTFTTPTTVTTGLTTDVWLGGSRCAVVGNGNGIGIAERNLTPGHLAGGLT